VAPQLCPHDRAARRDRLGLQRVQAIAGRRLCVVKDDDRRVRIGRGTGPTGESETEPDAQAETGEETAAKAKAG
jgi:hypothetical protein